MLEDDLARKMIGIKNLNIKNCLSPQRLYRLCARDSFSNKGAQSHYTKSETDFIVLLRMSSKFERK